MSSHLKNGNNKSYARADLSPRPPVGWGYPDEPRGRGTGRGGNPPAQNTPFTPLLKSRTRTCWSSRSWARASSSYRGDLVRYPPAQPQPNTPAPPWCLPFLTWLTKTFPRALRALGLFIRISVIPASDRVALGEPIGLLTPGLGYGGSSPGSGQPLLFMSTGTWGKSHTPMLQFP